MQGTEQRTDQRPTRRNERSKHPLDRDARERDAEPYAEDWEAEFESDRQCHALSDREFRGVGWVLENMKRFKKRGHPMWRICQASVGERVALQQIGELIVNERDGHAIDERRDRADREREAKDNRGG